MKDELQSLLLSSMTILNNSISRCNEPATGAWRAKDATVVPGQGPRLVVCSREGLGQQLLHVEGTLTAISRTEATRIKPCHPQITCILLSWRRYNVFCLLSVSSCVVHLKITAWYGRNDVFFYSLHWCDCRVMLVTCYIWNPNLPENLSELLEQDVIRQIVRVTRWHHCRKK